MPRAIFATLFIYFLCCAGFSEAQNLVINGSFEEITSCIVVDGAGADSVLGWSANLYPFGNGSDLFATCSNNPSYGVPQNGAGFQYPFDGDNYVGFLPYAQIEAPTGNMTHPLQEDSVYYISCSMSLADSSGRAMKGLGIALFDTIHNSMDTLIGQIDPVVKYNGFLLEKQEWVLIDTFFVANGGEKHVSIGLFDSIAYLNLNDGGYPNSTYYYLDNVVIRQATQSEINGIAYHALGFSVYPNPATDIVTIKMKNPSTSHSITVTDILGREMLHEQPSTPYNMDVSNWPNGIYLLSILSEEGYRSTERIIVQHK
ncbi:MAG: T9SS type A sorting domain-containing protein [Flavobacteriales bacterium]|nr:T9SS type A sorting domain-containing protein [Flavobacteriales bacterium]